MRKMLTSMKRMRHPQLPQKQNMVSVVLMIRIWNKRKRIVAMWFFYIPKYVPTNMNIKQLVEDLVTEVQPKDSQRKDDLHLRLRNILDAGIVVMPPTKQ